MSAPKLLLLNIFLSSVVASAQPINPASFTEPVRIACVGDSITYGAGTDGNSYPKQLQELLGNQWEVGNFGVSGRTLLRKGDHPYWNEQAYRDAIDFKPNVVIIKLGTNDTKPQNIVHQGEFIDDFRDLVKSFLELQSKPRVFICRPVPVIGKGNFNITEENLQKLLPHIDAVAKELNVGLIDMYAALEKKPEFIPDGVHPNSEGAALMAQAAFTSLTGKSATGP